MMPIIAVLGYSNSGKTSLIEFVVSSLSKEGLRIGTIKHVHHCGFTFDVKGKDTWRHSQAGAKLVICVSPEQIAIKKRRETSHDNLESYINIAKAEELDLLIIEGFHSLIANRKDIIKIITAKNEEDLKKILEGTVEPILATTGIFPEITEKSSKVRNSGIYVNEEWEQILQQIKTKILDS